MGKKGEYMKNQEVRGLEGFAEVTVNGVLFNGKYYTCSLAIKEKWFEQAAKTSHWTLSAYMNEEERLMILLPSQEQYIPCLMLTRRIVMPEIESYQTKIQQLKEARKDKKRLTSRN